MPKVCKTSVTAAILLILLVQTQCQAQAAKAVMKVVTGLTAAYAASQAEHSWKDYENARQNAAVTAADVAKAKGREVEFQSEIVNKMRAQGLEGSQDAVYSVYVNLDPNASAIYWANLFSRPDIFFDFDLEGHGWPVTAMHWSRSNNSSPARRRMR